MGKRRTGAEQRAAAHYARALKAGSDTDYDPSAWLLLVDWFDGCCLRCGAAPVTVDHVIPLSQGGSNTLMNLQPLCQSCNSSKGDTTVDYRDVTVLALIMELVTVVREV